MSLNSYPIIGNGWVDSFKDSFQTNSFENSTNITSILKLDSFLKPSNILKYFFKYLVKYSFKFIWKRIGEKSNFPDQVIFMTVKRSGSFDYCPQTGQNQFQLISRINSDHQILTKSHQILTESD